MRIPKECQTRGNGSLTATQLEKVYKNDVLLRNLGKDFVFDGSSLGFSPESLCPVGTEQSAVLTLGPFRRDGTTNLVEITYRNTGSLDIQGLVAFLRSGPSHADIQGSHYEIAIRWMNAVLRKDPASTMMSRPGSSSFFDRTDSTTMSLSSTGGLLEGKSITVFFI